MAEKSTEERISQKLAPASGGGVKGEKKGLVIGITIAIVVAALVGVIMFLVLAQKGEQRKTQQRNQVITPDNINEILSDMENAGQVSPGYYTVTMSNEWHFTEGDSISDDAYVENAVDNTNDVYFDIVRADNEDDVIYKSPIIPRGSALENIALDSDLDAGKYDCVMIYHLVDDQQNTISTLRVTLKIIVEK